MLILKVAYKVCIPTDIDVSLGHQARHSGGPANIDRSRAHSLVDEVPLSRAIFAVPPTPRDLCQSTLIGSGQRDVIAVISRSAKPRCSFQDCGGVARARSCWGRAYGARDDGHQTCGRFRGMRLIYKIICKLLGEMPVVGIARCEALFPHPIAQVGHSF